jgi:hypothetical protein
LAVESLAGSRGCPTSWIALAAAVIIGLIAAAAAIGVEAAVAAIVLVLSVAIDTITSGKQTAATTLSQIFGRSPPGA